MSATFPSPSFGGVGTAVVRPLARPRAVPRRYQPRYWFFAWMVLYTLTVPWPAYYYLSDGLRLTLFNLRPPLFAAVLGLTLVAMFMVRNPTVSRFVGGGQTARIFAVSLVYPVWYLLTGLFKGHLAVPSLGLYLLWSLACFLIVPALVRSARDLRWLTGGVALVLAIDLVHAMMFGPPLPQLSMEGRISYGYANPNYFSQLGEVIVVTLGFWLLLRPPPAKRWKRWLQRALWPAAWLAAMVLAHQAISRNVMVFLATLGGCYLLTRGGRRYLVFLNLFIIGIVAATLAIFATTDKDTLNDLSSKRFELWEHHIGHMLSLEDQAATWLIGPSAAAGGSPAATYDSVREEKSFEKLHVDNFFLEQLLEAGIIGLLMFLAPYLMLIALAVRRLGLEPDPRPAAWSLSVLLAAFVQGMFTATMPTFNAPLGIALVMFSVAPLYIAYPKSRTRPAPARRAPRPLATRPA